MRPHEFDELASLDAMGLLDEQERADFEAALNAASPEVQARVRRHQTLMTGIAGTLPDVATPPGLRARVIAAVQQAARSAAGVRRHSAADSRVPPLLPSRGVSSVWRVLAVGSAAAALVFGVVLMQFQVSLDRLQLAQQDEAWMDTMQANWDNRFNRTLSHTDTTFVRFASHDTAPERSNAQAILLINRELKAAYLSGDGYTSLGEGEFDLELIDGDGRVHGVLTFKPTANTVMRAGIYDDVAGSVEMLAADPEARFIISMVSDTGETEPLLVSNQL